MNTCAFTYQAWVLGDMVDDDARIGNENGERGEKSGGDEGEHHDDPANKVENVHGPDRGDLKEGANAVAARSDSFHLTDVFGFSLDHHNAVRLIDTVVLFTARFDLPVRYHLRLRSTLL